MLGTLFTKCLHRCAPTSPIASAGKWEGFLVHVLAISGELLLAKHTQTWNLFKMRLHVLSGSPPGCFVVFVNLANTLFIAQDLAHLGKPSNSPACPNPNLNSVSPLHASFSDFFCHLYLVQWIRKFYH